MGAGRRENSDFLQKIQIEKISFSLNHLSSLLSTDPHYCPSDLLLRDDLARWTCCKSDALVLPLVFCHHNQSAGSERASCRTKFFYSQNCFRPNKKFLWSFQTFLENQRNFSLVENTICGVKESQSPKVSFCYLRAVKKSQTPKVSFNPKILSDYEKWSEEKKQREGRIRSCVLHQIGTLIDSMCLGLLYCRCSLLPRQGYPLHLLKWPREITISSHILLKKKIQVLPKCDGEIEKANFWIW